MPPSATEPPFQNIAIVGFGLIGGSIALGGPRALAVDPHHRRRSPASSRARRGQRRDRSCRARGRRSRQAPTSSFWLRRWSRTFVCCRRSPRRVETCAALLTDVGGTKRDIVKAAAGAAGSRAAAFVGGHPIGGAEHGGFAFARADLFRGRPWILTPARSVSSEDDGQVDWRSFRAWGQANDDGPGRARSADGVPQPSPAVDRERVDGSGWRSCRRLEWLAARRDGASSIHAPRLQSGGCLARGVRVECHRHRRGARPADCAAAATAGRAWRTATTVDTVFANAARWRAELMKGRET